MDITKFIFLSLSLLISGCQVDESRELTETEVICEYDGETYEVDASFSASDGCNTCYCDVVVGKLSWPKK